MISLHLISGTPDYETKRFDLFHEFEEFDPPPLGIYLPHNDGADLVTIGVGFNLSLPGNRHKVYAKLGFTIPGLITELDAFLSIPQPLTDLQIQQALNTRVNTYMPGTDFELTDTQVEELFKEIAEEHEARVNRWVEDNAVLGPAPGGPYPVLPESLERLALLSLEYQGVLEASGKLADAIEAGNRAEAWFEIRYHTNRLAGAFRIPGVAPIEQKDIDKLAAGVDGGVAKRRFYESALFGLYESQALTLDEARKIYRMLDENRIHILRYESFYGDDAHGTVPAEGNRIQAAINDYGTPVPGVQVQTLEQSLNAARDAILADLQARYPTVQVFATPAAFLSVDLYVAGEFGDYLDARPLETVTWSPNYANGSDDLLVGSPTFSSVMHGGKGDDVLAGGDAADTLDGGEGDDILIGGAGQDIYIWNEGDGNDTIIDPDGGTLIVKGNSLNFGPGTMTKDPASNTWRDDTGNVVLSHNSPWQLALPGGAVVQLGEGFNPAQWGLTLVDEPEATLGTFTGDYVKLLDEDEETYLFDSVGNYQVNVQEPLGPQQDAIYGTANSDSISGGDLNDILSGFNGDDVIDGGLGDDALLGGQGADTLNGGDGADYIYGSGSGFQNKPTRIDTPPPEVFGTEWSRGFGWVVYGINQTSYGINGFSAWTLADDAGNVIDGGAGNDLIRSGTGADVVHGGTGDDGIMGLAGGDALYGDAGNDGMWGDGLLTVGALEYTAPEDHGDDTLDGGDGDDSLSGQGGNDVLFGGAGNDSLRGDHSPEYAPASVHGRDYLDGGVGDDILCGDGNDDSLFGGAGEDSLVGDTQLNGSSGSIRGRDYLDGGADNDYLEGGALQDTLVGGAGDDLMFGDGSIAVVAEPDQADDYLDGGPGNDSLSGGGGADTLIGGDGNDLLWGDSADTPETIQGADSLDGGAGDDQLVGAGGADTLIGGEGNDQLFGDASYTPASAHGDDYLDGGFGDDIISGFGGDDVAFGGDGDDQITGGAGNDYLAGQTGNDDLYGEDGDDVIEGGDGGDSLYGGAGNDVLRGGLGADHLDGGAGNDTYVFSLLDLYPEGGAADTIAGIEGNDTIVFDYGFGADDATLLASTTSGAVRLASAGSLGVLHLSHLIDGTSAVRQFTFSDGQEIGADRLVGERYAETVEISTTVQNGYLLGGSLADDLFGGGANSTLSGGRGNDTLMGGASVDTTYLFTRGDGDDTIIDPSTQGAGSGPKNTIELAGIAVADVSIRYRPGIDASLVISDGGGSVTLGTFSATDIFGTRTIDEVKFGTSLMKTWAELVNTAGVDIVGGGSLILDGTSVTDRVVGGLGNETIGTGAGDDTLDGGGGNDTMDGGADSDTYLFGPGSGQDVIDNVDTAAGKTDRVLIDPSLTRSQVRILRYENSLMIRVIDGSDRVLVGNYFDGAGLDEIRFADGTVYTPANVVLDSAESQATSGDDEMFGTPGNDVIDALAGNDAVFAGSGNDIVSGNDGADVLRGESGADTLDGGIGADTLYGGDGNDTLVGALNDWDTMYGEGGADQITGRGTLDGGAGDDQITGNGDLIGGDGNDLLSAGGDVGTSLLGGAGNDQLIGTVANWEELIGGAGNDTLDSGGGDFDELDGGDGSDVYIVRRDGDGSVDIWQNDASVGRFDTLRFGPDILPSQLTFSANNWGTLDIHVNGAPGLSVALREYLADDAPTKRLDEIRFDADPGTVWTGAQLEALAMTPSNENQYFRGTFGSDVIDGQGGIDYLHGRDGDDQLSGGTGNDYLYGEAGTDVLAGGAGNDDLFGGDGSDTYVYNFGDGNDDIGGLRDSAVSSIDEILFGPGIAPTNVTVRQDIFSADMLFTIYDPITAAVAGTIVVRDGFHPTEGTQILDRVRFASVPGTIWSHSDLQILTLFGSNSNDFITGFSTDDIINGNGGNDRLDGAAGNDDISGGPGYDESKGGSGDDVFRFGHGQGFDEISDTSGINEIVLDAGITPTEVALYRTSSTTPSISGFLPAKTSDGLALVLNGSEQLWVRNFFGGQSPRPISQIVFADGTIWDDAAIDANTVNQGGTVNSMPGTMGDDQYTVDHPSDTIFSEAADGGIDSVTSSVTYTLPTNVENLTLSGVLKIDAKGNTLINTIQGNTADNSLHGGGTVTNPDGVDTLIGGTGNDTYEVFKDPGYGVNTFNDVVTEAANEGCDTLIAYSHTATLPNNFEALTIGSFSGSYTAIPQVYQGNALDNVIDARLAALTGYGFRIDGGAGADVMIGPTSYSFPNNVDRIIRYVVDNPGDVVIGGPGVWDLIQVSFSCTLPESVEKIELTGSSPSAGTGNSSNNFLDGSTSSGANVLTGGAGDDQYTLGAGDTAVENAGQGNDTLTFVVAAGGSNVYDLAQFANFENIGVTDAAFAATLVGTDGNNQLTGNASANVLKGGGGNDQLTGGSGNDYYYDFGAGSGVDVITDTAGTDTIEFSSAQNTQIDELQFSQVGDNLLVTINAQDSVTIQSWFAGSANAIEQFDLWDDGLRYRYTKAQIDAKLAGTNSAPVVSAGIPSLDAMATQPFSLQVPDNAFTDIESQQSLTYSATLDNGSALPGWVTFDPDTRTFSGTPGSSDVGMITIRVTATDPGALSAVTTFFLSVEPFMLFGTEGDDILTGDTDSNTICGLGGNDTIYGLDGDDELFGNEGDDTLYGDAGSDYLNDFEGTNALYGGGGDDTMEGGVGNDLLDGGTGTDQMWGNEGDDTYVIDTASDFIEEFSGEGVDTVQSSITHTLGTEFENLTLLGSAAINGTGNSGDNVITGNTANNTLSGGSGNDTLDGGAGNDAMSGGQGNDTFYVDSTSDTITESSGQGADTVNSSVSFTLGSNVESLVLIGTGNVNGTGNTLVNTITGNAGNNTLSGGTGADTLIGGAGNDTYVVDNTGDVVTEAANEGTDLVQSSVTQTLANNVENLTLTGTSTLNGTGNALDNVLTGNSANNTLMGGAGNDTLNGGAGNDTMVGGQGNDTYVVAQTSDVVTEAANEGTDLVQSSVTHTLGNNVENLTLTGTSAINGTGNTLDNVLIGNSANNTLTGNAGNDTLDGGTGTDTMVGGAGNDVYFVNVSGDVTTESASQGIDTVNSAVTRTLAANIEILFLTGSSAINGTGLLTANLLRGNVGNNILSGVGGTDILEGGDGTDTLSNTSGNTLLNGGAGNDTLTGTGNNDLLIGGAGNDALTTGQGADIIVFNQGNGQDTVAASTTQDNTLSLGGGILYADMIFEKSGNNLILKTGGTDQITFTNYYSSTSNRSVDKLQIVIEDTSDYDGGSADPLHNKRIETFDFDGLVNAFDAVRAADPGLTSWALSDTLLAQHLSGSDTAAIGGDLAYRYGRFDSLSDISFTPALAILAVAGFGSSTQALQLLASLQDSSPRLS